MNQFYFIFKIKIFKDLHFAKLLAYSSNVVFIRNLLKKILKILTPAGVGHDMVPLPVLGGVAPVLTGYCPL